MTTQQRIVAATMLSASVMLAFSVGYLVARSNPLVCAVMVLFAPWGALRLTRRLQSLAPKQFPSRGLLFGFCGILGAMGVLLPHGPSPELLGLERATVPYQVAAISIYFVIGACGALLGAWLASRVAIASPGPGTP